VKYLLPGALIGLTLSALLLTGSMRVAGNSKNSILPRELTELRTRGLRLYSAGSYLAASAVFRRASDRARQLGLSGPAAKNLSSAGVCLYVSLNFDGAKKDFEKARDMARSSGEMDALAAAQNNLANLYLHMGERDKALQVAVQALSGREGHADPAIHGTLLFQKAVALAEMGRFSEAEPIYNDAIKELMQQNDLEFAARIQGAFGSELLKAGRLDDAESALNEGLRLMKARGLNTSANILASLAQLKSRRGDSKSATALFEAALALPPNISPAWLISSSRGQFRLENGNLPGALEDFREARRTALEMRADMVPADQDRIALESGLSSVMEGLVEAGNRLARQTGDRGVLRETFDAAEQDRLWSLRALVPGTSAWRSRLPDHYWELLVRYQSLKRTAASGRSPESNRATEDLRLELQHLETAAGESPVTADSGLAHAQSVLSKDSVLLSFLVTRTSAWVWAIDREHVDVYPLPAPAKIKADADAFRRAIRAGDPGSPCARAIYQDLFGAIPATYLAHSRWLIEPDGALYDLPFAALEPDTRSEAQPDSLGNKWMRGRFLVEHAAIETIPGALLLERGAIPEDGPFLGIGDPIYNVADSRYSRGHYSARSRGPNVAVPRLANALPRLPNTAGELESCSRAWGSSAPRLLTGEGATVAAVEGALVGNVAIVHFATHMITAPDEFHSGLIALSLDDSGVVGLLGPKQIAARPVLASLIVMNGCHSAQGESLPSAGLMGLTRAWIGAGAKAVIATGWDVPDAAAQSVMTDFYRALRSSPERGAAFALREAQLKAIQRDDGRATEWAAYSLLSRLQ
jgi:CHAT domain-containing protein/tetratricopeptide (TPR) repeat protein